MVSDAETAVPGVRKYRTVEQWRKNVQARVGATAFSVLVELAYLFRVMECAPELEVPAGLTSVTCTQSPPGWHSAR
jgi:hypothetical protein